MCNYHTEYIDSPIGPIGIISSSKGITGVYYMESRGISNNPTDGICNEKINFIQMATTQLLEYFDGRRTSFDIPLDIEGTPFQKKVWQVLLTIPYGHTTSYRDIAIKSGSPKGFRAVGRACGANPISIIIPCHRVLASNGSLGGYGGGIYTKKWLLHHELINIKK